MQLRRPPARIVDALLSALVAALILVELSAHWDDGYSAGSAALNLPLLLGVAACLTIRRTHPRLATAIAYALMIIPSLLVAHTVFFFGTLLPLLSFAYTDARLLGTRQWLPTLLAPAVLPAVLSRHQPGFDAADYLFWFALATAAIAGGRVMQRLDRQRETIAGVLATHVHDQEARERALLLDERARIARELHDVVAHAVSVMVVQGGAARLAVGIDDAEARVGLLAVEQTGREALQDLRRLLAVLRPDDSDQPVAPAPGLSRLDALATRMRDAGLDVVVEVDGTRQALRPGLDLSAYRIVQESLTNVLKHAGPTHVRVRIGYGDVLEIDVTDDGPRPDWRRPRRTSDGGHGLVGLRERAEIFGGSLLAGRHGPGWRVHALLPLELAVTNDPAGMR